MSENREDLPPRLKLLAETYGERLVWVNLQVMQAEAACRELRQLSLEGDALERLIQAFNGIALELAMLAQWPQELRENCAKAIKEASVAEALEQAARMPPAGDSLH